MKPKRFIARIIFFAAFLNSGIFVGSLASEPHLQDPPSKPAPISEFRLLTPPVIQWSTPDSFEAFVITSHPSACSLQIRKTGSTSGFTCISEHQHGLVEANKTYHRISVNSLSPGMTYEYRLLARRIDKFEPYKVLFGNILESDLYSVKLPGSKIHEVEFTVLNDLHKNIPLIHSLMDKVEASESQPQFVMLNGDILSHIEGEEDVAAILNLPGKYASENPVIWIRGNHECRGDFARYMTRYLTMPDGRYYYTFRRGPIQFLVLDSGEDKADTDPEYSGLTDFNSYRKDEEEWFKDIIEKAEWKSAPFRVLVTHIPIGYIPGDEKRDPKFFQPYKKRWAEIMNNAGLDLEIAAHYHRYYLEEPSDKRNFPVVIGGGPREDSAVIINVHASQEKLSLEVTNLNGEQIGHKSWPVKQKEN